MTAAEMERAFGALRKPPADDGKLAEAAVALAAALLLTSERAKNGAEKRQSQRLARMMDDPAGRDFTFHLVDRIFRPPTAARAAAQFRHLVDKYGAPAYLPRAERMALRLGAAASLVAPAIVVPAIAAVMRRESAPVILPAEEDKLKPLLDSRRDDGIRMNINQLGEAVLGEGEAAKRLGGLIGRLEDPDCDYLSVKISSIYSQIHLVGDEETMDRISERLRRLYRAAMANRVMGRPKFVNLDMEEYRDLWLTCGAFRRVLDEPEFAELEAGIVLQAYLPDSWPVQRELNEWARERVARGRAGIKIRLVKGANLAMERVDAELHGWQQAPYLSKEEVDANFKRMLHEGCKPENAAAVRLGVASHNLFDIAYALLLREREGVRGRVEFEMLEGMANHQARTVRDAAEGLLLYAPVVYHDDFHSAIAYLVRRLDENTSEGNFLHDLFGMKPGDDAWKSQKRRFLEARARRTGIGAGPRRDQDRTTETHRPVPADDPFSNAADTDWSLERNVRWIREIVNTRRHREPVSVPLVIGGCEEAGESEAGGRDPASPGSVAYRYALAGRAQVERALDVAEAARTAWEEMGFSRRAGLLRRAAAEMARDRGEATATMVMDGGKSVTEADTEVSEAIDFANYYAHGIEADGAAMDPVGTVLVTPPWNFPYAIPCGGILAALVAGNPVIFKPAAESVLTAWVLVNALWRAAIPREVLQFVPCPDNDIGRSMVTDPRVGAVVLTGAYETARMFLAWKPELRLFAETSGKNALVITAAADPDEAIRDLVKSAFGHSGQKCSAASLAIIEAEVYDSASFRRQLRDAAASLIVGQSWQFDATVTPLIREPGDDLWRGLTKLDEGEEWLLEPRMVDGNPCLWSPGIRMGVKPGSWFHRTECFGPVLGVMRAAGLDEAIRIQNESQFGLTGGIHTLDEREICDWKERVEVGNAYVNRPITGAIVQRQPFGGWKRSCFGPGAKAGGPNYVAQFGKWRNTALPKRVARPSGKAADLLDRLLGALPEAAEILKASAGSDAWWKDQEFEAEHDPSGLFCEANIFRYRKFHQTIIRAGHDLPDVELARLLLAATAMEVDFAVSLDEERKWVDAVVETEEKLVASLRLREAGVIRCPEGSLKLKIAALEAGWRFADCPVIWDAKREWPAWLREQAVSETLHRYGNVVRRR